ncbi:tRNA (guanosine(46)-N7)-methyltransferase TrmB [Actinospica sp.]|jgi:tRNA (guanine-N7-)-methyltransferase|uniref:tRNA (guanosine(46)-N7)-methyltransferase TrmB n=1 Tax=Actinospica sp. TaxID=1872142 RepID=UPI002B8F5716|nr:tRNA (guanosine(46)-N7)-methyltransferase TrmB [Actinospica sp.]HWG27367.1 tRNA (guanosine(46)-N7)-methyltransferase TrmB [Actinospica sp.]
MSTSANSQPSVALAEATASAPPSRHIRTFKPRRGRITVAQNNAIDRLWPRWGLEIPAEGEELDLARLFGRTAPLQLEIGCGMGDAVVAMASAKPDLDFLAVDVHTPGLGNVLRMAERAGLTNVRAASGDALDLLRRQIPSDALDAVHIYFPDPWPKARHHKRRIVRSEVIALIADRLRTGGLLHCATDWAEYAAEMLVVLSAEPWLRNRYPGCGYAPRPTHRPVTKFEARAVREGREVFDLSFTKI